MTVATPGRELAELVARHPTRRRILELTRWLEAASPRRIVANLAAPPTLGAAAYHVRVLAEAGALELVAERRVRGAVEHVYRVTDAGARVLEEDPLRVAIHALEGILEEAIYIEQDGAAIAGLAKDALKRIRELDGAAAEQPSSVAA